MNLDVLVNKRISYCGKDIDECSGIFSDLFMVRYYETIRFEHNKLKFNFTKEKWPNWKIQTIIGLIQDSTVSIES